MGQGAEEYKEVGGGEYKLPSEYFVSGWFKWSGTYNGWHMAFRLTMNSKPDN